MFLLTFSGLFPHNFNEHFLYPKNINNTEESMV